MTEAYLKKKKELQVFLVASEPTTFRLILRMSLWRRVAGKVKDVKPADFSEK